MRPTALADDHTGTIAVIGHAITAMGQFGCAPKHVCCLYPAVPLLLPTSLVSGFEALLASRRPFAFGVVHYGHPIQRALRLAGDGTVSMFEPQWAMTRSQDLEPAYHDAGQFYWGTASAFLDGLSPLSAASAGVVLPRERVVDIDTPEDWRLAESLHRAFRSGEPATTVDGAGATLAEVAQR